MAGSHFSIPPDLELGALRDYHDKAIAALTLYFSSRSPTYQTDFLGRPKEEVRRQFERQLLETDRRSCLILLSSLEAHFQVDCQLRRKVRTKEPLSKHFRSLQPDVGGRLQLDKQIFEGWKLHGLKKQQISSLRGAFKLRHWLAHGRYWVPKFGV